MIPTNVVTQPTGAALIVCSDGEVVAAVAEGRTPLLALAADINSVVAAANLHAQSALQAALKAGHLLTQAKEQVEHGNWETWLTSNCAVSPRTARAYMRLAKQWTDLHVEERQRVAELPLREAIRAISTPAAAPASQSSVGRVWRTSQVVDVSEKLDKVLVAQRKLLKKFRDRALLKRREIESLRTGPLPHWSLSMSSRARPPAMQKPDLGGVRVGPDGDGAHGQRGCLWASAVPMPAAHRHTDPARLVVDRICADRSSMKGVSAQIVQKYEIAARWLLEVLYQAFCSVPEVPAVLPRTPSQYSSHRPNAPLCGHAVSMRVLDAMVELGWVDEVRGWFDLDLGKGKFTRIRAAGMLRACFENQGISWVPRCPTPVERLILISDKPNGTPRRFAQAADGSDVERWQKNLYRINEFNLDQCIRLEMPDSELLQLGSAEPDDGNPGACRDGETPINFGRVEMRRIFAHGSLSKGGRFYGPWWQNVPGAYRHRLVINDDAVVEIDFSGIATTCLYAKLGVDPGEADIYDIGIDYDGPADPRRRVVKDYHNAKLNDTKGRHRPRKPQLALLGMTLQELDARLQKRHPAIFPHYGSGVGLDLQFVDSQIAEAVMLRFLEMGEVCLPIHDSFIVARRMRRTLEAVMQEEFQRIVYANCRTKTEPLRWDLFEVPTVDVRLPRGEAAIDALTAVLAGRDIVQGYYATWAELHHDECSRRALDERGCWMTDWLRGPPPGDLLHALEQLAGKCADQPDEFITQARTPVAESHGALSTILSRFQPSSHGC